jgi:tetratricopeptide (TPR) repeat protein
LDLAAWLQELRRRRVIRALLAWGLFSFAVLQVVEPVQHALGLAEWALKLVVAVLAVGFPVTAGLAWAFDLTRRGVERTAPPEGASPATARTLAGARPAVVLVLVGALLGGGVAWIGMRHAGPPAPPVDADGRVSVAVADFANQTGEPALDALSGLLITSLEQSRKLKVLTRGRMFDILRQAGRGNVERIDESAAREVGLKAGVRTLLLASIQKLGPTYVVELRAVDPQRDHYLFTLREQAPDQAAILPLIDRLSERTRSRLRESDADVQGSDIQVARAVTPNLEAYRHYFKGKELRSRLDDTGAADEFRKALELQPGFALAQLELALISAFWIGPDIDLLVSAEEGASQLPEKEREIVLGHADMARMRYASAARRGRHLVDRFGEDREALFAAAQFTEEEARAVPLLRRALALAPDDAHARVFLAMAATPLGLARETLEGALAEERARPSGAAATAVGMARLGTGDAPAAVTDFRRAVAHAPGYYAYIGLGFSLAYTGHVETLRNDANTLTDPLLRGLFVTFADVGVGRVGAVSTAMGEAGRLPGSQGAVWRASRALIHGWAGDVEGARRLGVERPPAGVEFHFWLFVAGPEERRRGIEALGPGTRGARMVEAAGLREAGDLEGAIRLLEPDDGRKCGLEAWLRGMIESDRGRHPEALAFLRRVEPCLEISQPGWFRLLRQGEIRLRIARALVATGKPDEARALLRAQLADWKDADPDLPFLLEVKAQCREIRC